MEELFRNVREACSTLVWSKGVELARADAVSGEAVVGGRVTVRVMSKDKAVNPTVHLDVEDGDWSCSCGGAEDPCAHVAAAVIALKRAREKGLDMPHSAVGGGKVVYRLSRQGGALAFEREIIHAGGSTVLEAPLTALTSGRVKGPPLTATEADLEIEVALGGTRRGALPAAAWTRLLKTMARAGCEVTLDGARVVVDPEPVGLLAVLEDEGPGVRLSAKPDPLIEEAFANGIARCPTGLRPIVMPALAGPEQKLLREGRFFARQELGELVGVVLPALAGKVRLEQRAKNLPRLGVGLPRLELRLDREGERLVAQGCIVYAERGGPPLARVKSGRLEILGEIVPARDIDAELRLKDELRRVYGLELEQPLVMVGEAAVRYVERLGRAKPAPGDARAGVAALGPRFDPAVDVTGPGLAAFTIHGALQADVAVGEDAFRVDFKVGRVGGERAADPARVLAAWQAGESLVPLLDGGYAALPSAWLAQHGGRVLDLLAARGADGVIPKALRPALADLADELGETPPAGLVRLRAELEALGAAALGAPTALPEAPLPPGFTATLRSYQRHGVDWLAYLRSHELGALLADDMGLGKTLQAIAVLPDQRGSRTLVVAPTSVLFNWRGELRRFRPDLEVCLYHGPTRALSPTAPVVLTTYALLRLDSERLAAERWGAVVFDEAQALKNPDSQLARAARRLDARWRLALSGTPVENRLDDLWSLMHLLNPGLLGDRRHFQERYVRPMQSGDPERAAALRARLKPFVLRREKRSVAPELPPRTETVLHVELSPEERAAYDVVRAAARQEVVERLGQSGGNVLAALEALLRLRQACCHPGLLPGGDPFAPSAKLALLVDTLSEAVSEGHKALVFSQWTSFLDLMEPALGAASLPFLRLDGATADRQAVVQAFQAEDGPPVLLMSLKAGGVGLNLTRADHVIIADPWWNPAVEDQAADRAHRIGQDRPVLVQRLVALQTVEERILALQEQKRQLASAALAGQGGAAAGLTRADLLALLD